MRPLEEKEENEEPKEEIGEGHEICDALEHASGLEDKGREGDAGEIHADSAAEMSGESGSISSARTRLSCEISAATTEPSDSSRTDASSASASDGERDDSRSMMASKSKQSIDYITRTQSGEAPQAPAPAPGRMRRTPGAPSSAPAGETVPAPCTRNPRPGAPQQAPRPGPAHACHR